MPASETEARPAAVPMTLWCARIRRGTKTLLWSKASVIGNVTAPAKDAPTIASTAPSSFIIPKQQTSNKRATNEQRQRKMSSSFGVPKKESVLAMCFFLLSFHNLSLSLRFFLQQHQQPSKMMTTFVVLAMLAMLAMLASSISLSHAKRPSIQDTCRPFDEVWCAPLSLAHENGSLTWPFLTT